MQLGEEDYTRFNVVINTNKLEGHQGSPAVGMQLDNKKLKEPKDINKKWVLGELETRLQLLLEDYNSIFCRDQVIHTDAWERGKDTKSLSRNSIFIMKASCILL